MTTTSAQTSKTETVTKQFDVEGNLLSETTVIVVKTETTKPDDLPTGMYL